MEEEQQSIQIPTKITEPIITVPNPRALQQSSVAPPSSVSGLSKYAQLLGVIEELGRDIRPTYAGSRSSAERIKRGIVHARILMTAPPQIQERNEKLMSDPTQSTNRRLSATTSYLRIWFKDIIFQNFRQKHRAMNLNNFTTLDTFDTELSADSVEWCPIEPLTDIFVCGTYQLSNNESAGGTERAQPIARLGRIYLFRLNVVGKLELLQQLDVPGVLDIKWMHVKLNHKILLGVVTSSGRIQIYELMAVNAISLRLLTEKSINEENSDVLALSLDWSSGKCYTTQSDVKVVVSNSKGSISTFNFLGANVEQEHTWNAHEYEAWIVAFDYWNTNVVYTGGDDCKFKWFDLRMGIQPAGSNNIHGAGVTSLHCNSAREFLLASGSYDEILRLWDVRQMRNPISEANLAGGIWRLKWEPKAHEYLIAACMYGGFKIINCVNDTPNVVGQYMEHQSISYGCDWSFLSSSEIERRKIVDRAAGTEALIATCSFYDHTLKLAITDLKIH